MEELNHTIFLLLNASEHPSGLLLAIATFFSEHAIWVIPVIIGIGWLRGGEYTRKVLLEATASGLAGLLINRVGYAATIKWENGSNNVEQPCCATYGVNP